MENKNELGVLLKKLRGNLSLREAANRTGLSHSYISDVEKGFTRTSKKPVNPSIDTLKRFSEAYNYPLEELLRSAGYLEQTLDADKDSTEKQFNEPHDSIDEHVSDNLMFPSTLKELRLSRSLTQEELGKRINVTKVSISGYENGNRTPDTDTLQKIADIFNVSTDYLLGRTDNPEFPKSNQDCVYLSDIEKEMLTKFRKLDQEAKEDIIDIIDMKYNKVIKRGTSSSSTNGEEAATDEMA